jgi:hypothetical protein
MKKLLSAVFLGAIATTTFAQTATSTTTTSTLDKVKAKLSLTLETEARQVLNNENEVNGFDSYYLVEPGYKIDKKNSFSIGAQYNVREFENEAKEDKNRDHLDNAFVKFLHKAASYRDNGVADLRLQARYYRTMDPLFKKYYGSNGDYQLRAYFGRPLTGKLKINKYTSYLRYKKYSVNSEAGNYSRDYELRARISPTYNVTDQLEAGLSLTYNHIFGVSAFDTEEVDASVSARYSFNKGAYAVMVRGDIPWMESNDNGVLAKTEDTMDQLAYALTFSAYL